MNMSIAINTISRLWKKTGVESLSHSGSLSTGEGGRRGRILLLFMFLLCLPLSMAAQNVNQLFKEGKALYEAKNYDQAFPKLKVAAEKGHKKAQYRLGRCYEKGRGVAKDEALAFQWYTKSALKDYPKGQYALGMCYKDGIGTAKDPKKAVEYFAKAAQGDNADALTWTVTDQETGEAPEGITFDEKGTLSVSKDLTAKKTVVITAASETFGTSASCTVIAVPVIRGIAANPKTVTLYSDSDDSAVIRVTAGENIGADGLELSWTEKPKRIAEVIPETDGTFTLKALAAGNTTVTFTEAGGKTASVKVSVMRPVQSMKLSSSGNPVPGGTVKAAADIKPGNAGNRKVVWSLDVGEDIATVNDYGRIRISRNAPIGTVITVTCTANGAKEPLVETLQLEVTGK